VGLSAVIGVQSDRRGVVWILDMGGEGLPPKLVAWDTRRDELHRVLTIPPHATVPNSFQQDFAIDEVRGAIFIADVGRGDLFGPSDPAIVAVDLEHGHAGARWRATRASSPRRPLRRDRGGYDTRRERARRVRGAEIGLDP
jgi:hypothetical protein